VTGSARRRLGGSGVEVTPIGLGCWQFSQGRGPAGWFWPALSDPEITAIVEAALAGGITWFDTAEMYGGGASERALARALHTLGIGDDDVVIATKWLPLLRRASSIVTTIDERIEALGGYSIDLHQVHQPWSFSSTETEMEAMADLHERGVVASVGVSNFDEARMRRAHRALAERGIPLASNQVSYSLLDRGIERDGVLDAARELGVTIIAYSPLAQGLLTGAFHDDPRLIRGRPGFRKWTRRFHRRGLEQSRPLVDELRRVGDDHGATPAQVALNWLVTRHGDAVVAIPGATTVRQAEENAAALRLTLDAGELARIDDVSRAVLDG
jgi:aryl-alcohol dehydrogenase-like predicted oxidoreductase